MRGTRKIDGKQYTAYASGTKAQMIRLKEKLLKESPSRPVAIHKSWRATEPKVYILYTR
jgi:hypothetical protein